MQMGRLAQAALVFLNRGRRAVCLGRLLTPLTISKMAWLLEPNSGPFPGPWEGKDAVSWIWEIYRDGESRRVLIEVSGTAMAIADEYLPEETARARATSGRSEIEKILELDDPPNRISLGTTGYLGESDPRQPRPDFLIKNAHGDAVAVVEVKNPEVLTAPAAVAARNQLAHGVWPQTLQYIAVLSQNRGFLFRLGADPRPVAEFPMIDVVRRYYPAAMPEQRFRGAELEIIVQQWLRELAGGVSGGEEAVRALSEAGFVDAVRGGQIEPQPT
jgi:hypothetical protein